MSALCETAVRVDVDAPGELCRFFGCAVADLLEYNDKAGDGGKTDSLK